MTDDDRDGRCRTAPEYLLDHDSQLLIFELDQIVASPALETPQLKLGLLLEQSMVFVNNEVTP
jgi:hypothetical protein